LIRVKWNFLQRLTTYNKNATYDLSLSKLPNIFIINKFQIIDFFRNELPPLFALETIWDMIMPILRNLCLWYCFLRAAATVTACDTTFLIWLNNVPKDFLLSASLGLGNSECSAPMLAMWILSPHGVSAHHEPTQSSFGVPITSWNSESTPNSATLLLTFLR
jgi:hypothetical protein